MSIVELQELRSIKENEMLTSILRSYVGEQFETEKIERIFPRLNQNGKYILSYDNRKLGVISYRVEETDVSIDFDPTTTNF